MILSRWPNEHRLLVSYADVPTRPPSCSPTNIVSAFPRRERRTRSSAFEPYKHNSYQKHFYQIQQLRPHTDPTDPTAPIASKLHNLRSAMPAWSTPCVTHLLLINIEPKRGVEMRDPQGTRGDPRDPRFNFFGKNRTRRDPTGVPSGPTRIFFSDWIPPVQV